MFDHFTFDKTSKTGTARHDEDEQACSKDESSPAALSQSQTQPLEPYPALDTVLDNTIRSESEPQKGRKMNQGIDNITNRLSNSHLLVERCHHPPPLSRESTLICSSASCFPPSFLKLEAGYRLSKSLLSNKSPRGTASTRTSAMAFPSASTLEDDPVKFPPHPRKDAKRLRRQVSSKADNDPKNAWAIQTLFEDMVSTGAQCNVYTPPQAPATPVDAEDTNVMDYELEATSLEVDETTTGSDAGYESFFIEKFLSLRRASGTTGIRRSGFPLHPSSTDTALRCQHLVRNKPRMRRRTKLSRQSSLARLSAGEVSSLGSYSPA